MNLPFLILTIGTAAYWRSASLQALQMTCQVLTWRALTYAAYTMKGGA